MSGPSRVPPRFVAAILAVLLVACFNQFASRPALSQETPLVTGERIPFDREQPAKVDFGAVTYRGGLVLHSNDRRFGGFSGLNISEDGHRLTAVSDQGHWFLAKLEYNPQGALAGLRDGRLERIHDHKGRPLKRKGRADAEALARSKEGGLVVGFEQHHNILDYDAFPGGYARARERIAIPDPFEPADLNSGIEALARLGDGRLLALVEQGRKADLVPGYIWDGEAWTSFLLRTGDGFKTTGATRLPGGDILILERRFNLLLGPAMRLRRIPAQAIQAGVEIEAPELVRLAPPLAIDNMEGISARRGTRGETLIYIISDNNFNLLQRNLLLVFELKEAPEKN